MQNDRKLVVSEEIVRGGKILKSESVRSRVGTATVDLMAEASREEKKRKESRSGRSSEEFLEQAMLRDEARRKIIPKSRSCCPHPLIQATMMNPA